MNGSGLPLWLLLASAIMVAVALTGCAMRAGYRFRPVVVLPDHNSALSPFMSFAGIVYGVLLGFTVITNWDQFASTRVIIAGEASALTTMYRQTIAMPEDERDQVRPLVRQYAEAVAGPEWNQQSSNVARAAISGMYRVIGHMPADAKSSPVNAEFLSQMTALASDRNERITGTRPRMPALLWAVLISGALIMVGLLGLLRLPTVVSHVLIASLIASLLAMLLTMVYALDYSFATDHEYVAGPFKHAIEIFNLVDEGT